VQYLFQTACTKPELDKTLKIGTLNEKLDELVRASGAGKSDVLRWLILHTSPGQMKWIVDMILVKNMRVLMSILTIEKIKHPRNFCKFPLLGGDLPLSLSGLYVLS
jgi:hypothetical protein